MKRFVLIAVAMLMMVMTLATSVSAANSNKADHKIKNKWDLAGSFVAHPGYNWGGLTEGATWTYKVHIKEAMNDQASVGSINFKTGDINVVGHVKETKGDYAYWSGTNLAAVGTAKYDGMTYYFMFLFSERAMWFVLSDTPYDDYWATGTVWPPAMRDYQLHSKVPDETLTIDYKAIHE